MKKRTILKVLAGLPVALFALLLVIFFVFTGPRDLEKYPDAATSPYLLPWPGGVPRFCVQGNRAVVSHRGWEEYAFDFTMPVGSDVCAARAGTVVTVIVEHDGHGFNKPNNKIVIQHEDGTLGNYLHLKQNGNKVKVGDVVKQGDIIAESGHVGHSSMPHLHFHVTDAEEHSTIPITFSDVHRDLGIPRMFKTYISGNRKKE